MNTQPDEPNGRPAENDPPRKEDRNDTPLFFFEVLARGGKEILIDYRSQVYRLKATRNGKLILNK